MALTLAVRCGALEVVRDLVMEQLVSANVYDDSVRPVPDTHRVRVDACCRDRHGLFMQLLSVHRARCLL